MRPRVPTLIALLVALGLAALLVTFHGPWQAPSSRPTSVPEDAGRPRDVPTARLRGAPPPSTPASAPAAPAAPTARGEVEHTSGSGRVDVLVVDEAGIGIPGASVRLHDPLAETPAVPATADDRGRASWASAPVGEIHASATAAGFEGSSSWGVVREGESLALRIVLRPEVLLVVRVVADLDGSAIEGATIRLLDEGSLNGRTVLASHGTPHFEAGVTDAEGRLTLPVARGRLATVQAVAPGYATKGQSIERRGAGPEVELRLAPGIALRGTVRTPSGAPCPDATVWIVPDDVPDLLRDPHVVVGPEGSTLTADPEMWSSSTVEVEGEIHKARILKTDAHGRYVAEGFADGSSLRVLAEAGNGARGLSPVVLLARRARDVFADVALESRSTLVVHTLPVEGHASGGSQVALRGTGTTFFETEGDGQRDAYAGPQAPARFTGLGAHTYELVVRIPGAVPVVRDVLMPGEGRVDVTIEGRAGLALEGIVVDAEGQPLANAQIQWWTEGGAVEGHGGQLTDEGGRFVVEGIDPEATWTVRAESGTHVGRSVEGGPAQPKALRIELAARPMLRGRLVLEAGMTARPYVWVGEQSGERELFRTATVDADGSLRYALQNHDVECVVMLLPWEGADVHLGTFLMAPGQSRDVGTIHVTAGRRVRGRVVAADGAPLRGASVRVEHPAARGLRDGMMRPRREALTGVEGTFEVDRVHDGPAVVVVEAKGHAEVEVLEDGSGDPLTVRLRGE